MTAPIITSIDLAWLVLAGFARLSRTDPAPWAAVIAGLACAAFGAWYY